MGREGGVATRSNSNNRTCACPFSRALPPSHRSSQGPAREVHTRGEVKNKQLHLFRSLLCSLKVRQQNGGKRTKPPRQEISLRFRCPTRGNPTPTHPREHKQNHERVYPPPEEEGVAMKATTLCCRGATARIDRNLAALGLTFQT